MAALTNGLQAIAARAKQTIARRPNAVADLHKAVRDSVARHAAELREPGPQIDALLNAMSAVDAAALNIDDVQRPGACTYLGIVENDEYAIAAFILKPGATIPLHDHPGMTVLSKLLFGSLRVTSYDMPECSPPPATGGLGLPWLEQPARQRAILTLTLTLTRTRTLTLTLTVTLTLTLTLPSGGDCV